MIWERMSAASMARENDEVEEQCNDDEIALIG